VGEEAINRDATRGLAAVKRYGLLPVTDARLPSLVSVVVGTPVRGSWWSHPKGKAIFAAATELEDHKDVALVKLVSGKYTFVHRPLWPALLAMATARAPWQMYGLAPPALRLLERVEDEGVLPAEAVRRVRDRARILEKRLLLYARSVHTESGAHDKDLESWAHWARRRRVKRLRTLAAGRDALDEALLALVAAGGGSGRMPWWN
jgi:hypothetical protein